MPTNIIIWLRWLHGLVIVLSLAVIASSIGLFVFFLFQQEIAEELTTGRRPNQFYGRLATDLLDDYGGVLSVGHNSGGTLAATRQALLHHADVIEIDLAEVNGRLVSAHFSPLPLIGHRLFRGPSLEEVWDASGRAGFVKLDFKESSVGFQTLVLAFLAEHRGERNVIVSSRDIPPLAAVAAMEPQMIRLLSIPDTATLERFRETRFGLGVIDGVTINEALLDEPTYFWLRSEGLLVFAWTVNDIDRVNALVRLGVNAITTDNLAIMELLGRSPDQKQELPRREPMEQAARKPAEQQAGGERHEDRPGESHLAAPEEQAELDVDVVLRDEEDEQRHDDREHDQTARPPRGKVAGVRAWLAPTGIVWQPFGSYA